MNQSVKKVGIREVASHLGLSVSTVSRALNGYNDVNPSNRERVEQTAVQLGYKASYAAANLRSKQTRNITFMVSKPWTKFVDPFFLSLLDGVELVLRAQGYDLQIVMARDYEKEIETIQDAVESNRCDGILFGRTRPQDERIEFLEDRKFPFVTVGRTLKDEHSWVDVDHVDIGYRATERLIQLGHRRIAHLVTPLRYTYSHHAQQGYRQALADHGIPHDPALEVECYLSRKTGGDAARELLSLGQMPTALYCSNDMIALSAIEALRRFNIQVGKDIAVIGSDDMPLAAYVDPGLTTFRQDLDGMGMRMGQMMLSMLSGIAEPQQQKVKAELIVRGTDMPYSRKNGDEA